MTALSGGQIAEVSQSLSRNQQRFTRGETGSIRKKREMHHAETEGTLPLMVMATAVMPIDQGRRFC